VPSAVAPGLPKEFDDVIARAMAKDPNDRYLSAGDLGRAAKAAAQAQTLTRAERSVATGDAAPGEATAVAGAPTAASPAPAAASPAPTTVSAPPSAGGRRRTLAIVGAVVAAAVIALIVILVAGGGGGGKTRLSKADYEDQVSQIELDVSTAATKVSVPQVLPNISNDRLKIASELGKVETAYKTAASKLGAISPPKDVDDLHKQSVTTIATLGHDIGATHAAAETGDSRGYATAFERYGTDTDKLNQIGIEFRKRGYTRLGATPGNDTGRALTGEERKVAETVSNAQMGFRDGDIELYCLSRATEYLAKAYGGSYPFATCKKAGKAGAKAEDPALLKGGDLTIDSVTIDQGGKGNRAVVTATGDNSRKTTIVVTRKPPSDDVWRILSFR
jgi:hypothetical protein